MPKCKSFFVRTCLTALLCSADATLADTLDSTVLDLPIPEVLTPIRLRQPRTEVPASVTVIDRQLIESSGIRELPELLRLVPGMAVGARSGWDYVVSYHGTSRRNSRRMQVLIDGRSVYQAGFATIDWDDIPLAMEDIERIEVVRGPDTAAYGANAFLGIINIITKHPDDSPHLRFKATRGNLSTEDYYASTSGNIGQASYRLSAAARRDSGFDHNEEGKDRRDSKNLQFFTGRWMYSPLQNWNIDFQLGYKSGIKTEDYPSPSYVVPSLPPIIAATPPDHDVRDYYLSLHSEHFLSPNNSLKWQLDYNNSRAITEWLGCSPALFLGIPSTAVTCGMTNENSTNTRIDFDLQDTMVHQTRWKLVSGFHAQQQKVDSETYYNGKVGRYTYQLFANFEYHFSPYWAINLGGSEEYEDYGNRDFSPRVALMFFPSENQSIRAVYSEAIRSPDLFENEVDWTYTVRNLDPAINSQTRAIFQQHTVAPGNLKPERIHAREVGYYSLWLQRRLAVDLKVFREDFYDLISQTLAFGKFSPNNDTRLKETGFEGEADFKVSEQLRLRASYALLNSWTAESNEEDLTPHKSGSVGIIYDPSGDWQLASFYYYAYPINENKFTRLDFRLAKTLPFFAGRVRVSGVMQHYFYKYADLFRDNQYDSPNRIYLTMDLIF